MAKIEWIKYHLVNDILKLYDQQADSDSKANLNKWHEYVEDDEYLYRFFIRYATKRWTQEKLGIDKRCVVLSNIFVHPDLQNNGILKYVMSELERMNITIAFENVHNDWLRDHLIKKGYKPWKSDPSKISLFKK